MYPNFPIEAKVRFVLIYVPKGVKIIWFWQRLWTHLFYIQYVRFA